MGQIHKHTMCHTDRQLDNRTNIQKVTVGQKNKHKICHTDRQFGQTNANAKCHTSRHLNKQENCQTDIQLAKHSNFYIEQLLDKLTNRECHTDRQLKSYHKYKLSHRPKIGQT